MLVDITYTKYSGAMYSDITTAVSVKWDLVRCNPSIAPTPIESRTVTHLSPGGGGLLRGKKDRDDRRKS